MHTDPMRFYGYPIEVLPIRQEYFPATPIERWQGGFPSSNNWDTTIVVATGVAIVCLAAAVFTGGYSLLGLAIVV